MSFTNITIEELIEALGLGIYHSDKHKAMTVRVALHNAYLQGKLDAIAEYEGLGYAADQPIPFELTEKGKFFAGGADLTTTDTLVDLKTVIDNGIRVDVETPKPVYKTMAEIADEAGF